MSVLEARNITKVFPGTVALDDVSVSFDSGKVHAIVGKNGSGKSTLLKIISGAQQATSGVLILDGKEVKISSTTDAFKDGIATVYQELSLVPHPLGHREHTSRQNAHEVRNDRLERSQHAG